MKKILASILCLALLVTPAVSAMADQTGIDVSHYQGDIDWTEVAGDGVEFVIIKATEGNSYTDPNFVRNAEGANAAGIAVGAYHFARFSSVSDAEAEAAYFLSVIGDVDITYPVALDLEVNGSGLSTSALTEAALAFCETVEEAGYTVLVYSYSSFFSSYLDVDSLDAYDLWVAKYSTTAPSLDYAIWQYSDSGTVSGIDGNVDLNKAVKDLTSSGASDSGGGDSGGSSTGSESTSTSKTALLQETLNGRYAAGLDVDGIYGPKTATAIVKGVQTELNDQFDRGLAVDGIYGARTTAAFVNVRYGATGNLTYLIQSELYEQGYYSGDLDGIFGSGTLAAVRAFQQAQGLSVDGIVGVNTARALFA